MIIKSQLAVIFTTLLVLNTEFAIQMLFGGQCILVSPSPVNTSLLK